MVNVGVVFPGQGAQQVGMGLALCQAYPAARRVYQQADDLLGVPLSRLCFEGPEDELRQTINAQPALFVTSLAAWAALCAELGAPPAAIAFAGHSLGEYAALVAGGALDFAAGLALVRARGRLMQAAEARPGGMAAVLGIDDGAVEEACAAAAGDGVVVVANYNAPGQTVISGEHRALERALAEAKGRGARRVVPLAVSGAFHSPLMESAAAGLRLELSSIAFRTPETRTFANVTGLCYASGAEAPALLAQQVTAPVRWTACLQGMAAASVEAFVEVGPGQVLAGLVKRTLPDARTTSVGAPDEVRGFAAWLADLGGS